MGANASSLSENSKPDSTRKKQAQNTKQQFSRSLSKPTVKNSSDNLPSNRSEKNCSPSEGKNSTKRNMKKQESFGRSNKNKSVIDAATEIDVLKIVRKNNHKKEDFELIDRCLLKHFFMRTLESDARNEIIKEMSLCKVDADTFIFRQDSIGNFFYIIKEGEVELYVNENHIKNLCAGESFGELALLHGASRSAGVKTVGITYLWCLERRNFRKIVDHINYLNYEENKRFIESIDIFTSIENEFKSILASNMIKEFYEKDKYIVKGNIIFINKLKQKILQITLLNNLY